MLAKISKYKIKAIVFLIIVSLGYVWYVNSQTRVAISYELHKDEFTSIANDFLGQDKIKNIQVSSGWLHSWESVNRCSRHQDEGKEWSCTEGQYPATTEVKFGDLGSVLEYQHISESEYNRFSDFMHKYNLSGMGKDGEKGLFEIESGLKGLRYYKDSTGVSFEPDNEFVEVKKIDGNWWSYTRDWN